MLSRQATEQSYEIPHSSFLPLEIKVRYLQGVLNKGRELLSPIPLFYKDPEPCFASNRAEQEHYYFFEFSSIRIIDCYAPS
jgi:hypothetical protein